MSSSKPTIFANDKDCPLVVASSLRCTYLCRFSKPRHERVLYRAIRRQRPTKIVEIGVGHCVRSGRLIEVAKHDHPAEILYCGIDLFEARQNRDAGLDLRQAYRRLSQEGVRIRLCPGELFSVLSSCANSLAGTDMLVIAAEVDSESMTQAWKFVPRMLHDRSLVFVEESGVSPSSWRQMDREEIDRVARWASSTRERKAA